MAMRMVNVKPSINPRFNDQDYLDLRELASTLGTNATRFVRDVTMQALNEFRKQPDTFVHHFKQATTGKV